MIETACRWTRFERSIVDIAFWKRPKFHILERTISVESPHIGGNNKSVLGHTESDAVGPKIGKPARRHNIGVYRDRAVGDAPRLLLGCRPDRDPGSLRRNV